MPSSSSSKKKHSKSKPEAAAPPATPPPRTPSRPDVETDLAASLCLPEASRRYPSFIGPSAFVAQVSAVENGPNSRDSRIWLSEPAMVSSSLAPGTLVSVSIASSMKTSEQMNPLQSLVDQCVSCYGLETGKTLNDDATGNYFVLATVFPSTKVLKNGVRLSSNISCTMGCPPLGTIVFVYPVQKQYLSALANGSNELHSTESNCLLVYNCKELYLRFSPHKDGFQLDINNSASMMKSHVQSDNDIFASPSTPSNGSKFSNASVLSSPRFEDSASSMPIRNSQSMASFNVIDALGDESSKKLLEACATSWLFSRYLLLGNLVSVPMFSEVCIFQVIGAKKAPAYRADNYFSNGISNLYLEDSDVAENVNEAIFVNCETKVFLYLESNAASEEPTQTDLPSEKCKAKVANPSIYDNISKLGGLSKEYTVLKDIISSSVKDVLSSFGLRTTRGVLLHGPPGTGKTSLAQLCARDVGVKLFQINGPEIVTQYFGESEQALHDVFDSAIQAAPAVVFIDELDAIAPARKDGSEELSQRMVATLLNLMDGISRTEGLLVIAATNRPDHIEPALRRPGRFDKEIEIGVPSPKQRLDILFTLLCGVDHSLSDLQVEHLATVTHGFVGADLAALCNEAALICLRRYANLKKSCDDASNDVTEQPKLLNGETNSRDQSGIATSSVSESDISVASNAVFHRCMTETTLESMEIISDSGDKDHNLKVSFECFQKARMKIRPSAMREV
ncbi:hypothetical protein PIB30_055490 [Stylosanthes scabra]|uniref:AAA+ ATPase domain-containing protein n=1 Tax=Stylosanthes scabra TaxID=79078 RepID=A0ABU6UM43_9FABA|nr:hypothetical protein [Stylosanthes scabra]